jgi:streptogramin lyase
VARGLINSWILALRYIGDGPNGQGFDGPRNVAFDKDGNAWINNNFAFQPSSADPTCGSTRLLELTPTGRNAPGAPFGGEPHDGDGWQAGGLYGAGFGIAVDPKGAVWVTNFGFQTGGCTNTATDLFVSVSNVSRGFRSTPRAMSGR